MTKIYSEFIIFLGITKHNTPAQRVDLTGDKLPVFLKEISR